jgi:DNA-binding transcriptional LysR family regulator
MSGSAVYEVIQVRVNMDKLQSIRVFIKVVQAGSFTAAADQVQATTAGVSRSISFLEQEIGARLLQRTTRHMHLTDVGRRYLDRVSGLIAELDQADAEAAGSLIEPWGTLSVHCMPGIALSHLTAAIVNYQTLHPLVAVKLSLAEGLPNLIEEGFDVSLVAASQLPDSAFVSHRLGSTYSILAASPEYVRTHGEVTSVEDLVRHTFLRFEVSPGEGRRMALVRADGRQDEIEFPPAQFTVNSDEAMKIALRAGAGIGTIGIHSAVQDLKAGHLVRLLHDTRVDPQSLFAVYASRRYLDAKIRTFVAFIKDVFEHQLPEQQASDSLAAEVIDRALMERALFCSFPRGAIDLSRPC